MEVSGVCYVTKLVACDGMPWGYHRLRVAVRSHVGETLLVVAPRRVYAAQGKQSRGWGLFVPLYALRGSADWGAGDFSDLERLTQWTADQGGSVVATLPLLPSFFDGPFDHSPYTPVSRLFWNEFYIDVRRVPELAEQATPRNWLDSQATRAEIAALHSAPLVQYNQLMAFKRRILSQLSTALFESESNRRAELECFVASRPEVEVYARFRAVVEHAGKRWTDWPEPWRSGDLKDAPYDNAVKQYYLYTQWMADCQLSDLSRRARDRGLAWYLDFPLGAHAQGYDVWRYAESFAQEMRGGAPPDSIFVNGQDWGFPPLHPEGLRRQRYAYFIDSLRHHLRYTSLLRIDHVMSLHRLYWVPAGCSARDGAYVRYRAEELYAILSIESHRHQTAIVGENLGTVPAYVNAALKRHAVSPMYVLQYELNDRADDPLPEVAPQAVASLNTHDLPTFAAFFEELDIDDRRDLDLLGAEEAAQQRVQRTKLRQALGEWLRQKGGLEQGDPTLTQLFRACLAFLGTSSASMVLVNIEDLWLETGQQNVPGTVEQRPNWRRRTKYTLDELMRKTEVVEVLQYLNGLRKLARNEGERMADDRPRPVDRLQRFL